MSKPTDEMVRQALRAFIRRNSAGGNVLAKVLSVDEDAMTCVLVDDEDETVRYNDVQLRPVLDGNEAMTIFPAINSWVTAEPLEETGRLQVTTVSKVSKWRLVTNTAILQQDANGLRIERNGDTLAQVLSDLIAQIQAITVNVTAVGAPTGVPINNAAFTAIANRLNNILA